ncbi:Aste57867_4861 [Aphanomyces stellatus]|uniref:Aste57867_4861 protein n=1 Tax=Aphanomyces stellatus TaxID=120398 RepID=A0A485KC00_9STRA|nr:hypothetical protein As57867_004848 [Aphanomyces stellatus]VFT81954.1 Aste57867_4861 [Aphanomyces stellatus]
MGQHVLEEERSKGHVLGQVYQIYLDEAGGWCAVWWLLFVLAFWQATRPSTERPSTFPSIAVMLRTWKHFIETSQLTLPPRPSADAASTTPCYMLSFTRGYSLVEMAPTWTWSIARDIYLAPEQFGGPANLSHHRCNDRVRTTRPHTMETSSQAFLNGRDEPTSTLHTDVSVLAGTISISEMASETARRRGYLSPFLGSTQPTFVLLNTLVEKVNFDSSGPAISIDIRQSQAKAPPSMPSNSQPAPFTHPNDSRLFQALDPDVLQNLDIPLVAHLPLVGSNLQDHPAIAMTSQVHRVVDHVFQD